MVESSEVPAAVEGSKMLVCGLDIKPKGRPRPLSGTNELIYPFDVKKRGISTIVEEYPPPKQPQFRPYSFVNLGDKISGPIMWGFSTDPIGDIKPGGSGRSSSHTGQELEISGICFMVLIQGWRGQAIDRHPKNVLML